MSEFDIICANVERYEWTGLDLADRLESGARDGRNAMTEQEHNALMEWAYAERLKADGRAHLLTW